MKYKLICIDMDGTLLNDDKKISNQNIEAIKKAHDKGVNIAICTGRIFISARYFAELIGVKAPIIASNGAYIREKDKEEVVYKVPLGKDNCEEIEKILNRYDFHKYYNQFDSIVSGKAFPKDYRYVIVNNTLPKKHKINLVTTDNMGQYIKENSDEILKCVCISTDFEKLSEAKAELLKIDGIEAVSSGRDNIEIMNRGVSKGRAVSKLADFYNISSDEVICIGDNENDISMIKYAGLGVAMGNGESYVKDVADYVTNTNNNSGVAKVIEKFIL